MTAEPQGGEMPLPLREVRAIWQTGQVFQVN